ncbi:hypothetical protein Gogos_004791, partial [Gossypium gossypioides]|nr:hypothetical protein [Gossypium gossypioides]
MLSQCAIMACELPYGFRGQMETWGEDFSTV